MRLGDPRSTRNKDGRAIGNANGEMLERIFYPQRVFIVEITVPKSTEYV